MTNQLVEDNMNLVYALVSKEYPTYVNDEDIIQSGMLGLCKAADKWDESKGVFSTYAWRCIRNEIIAEFRKRAKHQGVLSLDYELDNGDGERVTFGDYVQGQEDVGYVDLSVDLTALNPKQRKIYELCKTGMNMPEIGREVGVSKQYVWQTLRKIRGLRG